MHLQINCEYIYLVNSVNIQYENSNNNEKFLIKSSNFSFKKNYVHFVLFNIILLF